MVQPRGGDRDRLVVLKVRNFLCPPSIHPSILPPFLQIIIIQRLFHRILVKPDHMEDSQPDIEELCADLTFEIEEKTNECEALGSPVSAQFQA